MATYGGVLRRSAAVVERARDGARSTRKAIVRFARPQSFAAPPDAEAAAVRAVRNIRSFRFYYAFLLWLLLLASLVRRRRATMLFLMAASKFAFLFGALLKAFPNSALLRRILDRRVVTALVAGVIGTELVVTRAVPQFLLAMGIGVPAVLLHAVFRARDDLSASGEDSTASNGGEFSTISEKKEDLELGSPRQHIFKDKWREGLEKEDVRGWSPDSPRRNRNATVSPCAGRGFADDLAAETDGLRPR